MTPKLSCLITAEIINPSSHSTQFVLLENTDPLAKMQTFVIFSHLKCRLQRYNADRVLVVGIGVGEEGECSELAVDGRFGRLAGVHVVTLVRL